MAGVSVHVAPQTGESAAVRAGQSVRVTDIDGHQVGDFFAARAGSLGDWLCHQQLPVHAAPAGCLQLKRIGACASESSWLVDGERVRARDWKSRGGVVVCCMDVKCAGNSTE